jgi:hypothetical protein
VVVLNVAVSKHAKVGCGACVPVFTQLHEVVLNWKLSQQFTTGGCTGCVPWFTHEQIVVLNW